MKDLILMLGAIAAVIILFFGLFVTFSAMAWVVGRWSARILGWL